MTEEMIRPMTLVDYEDPESHVPVKACSPDNGRTVKIYFTPWGIVWHADDVEVLWNDFLLDKVKSVMSFSWDQIQGKPELVVKSDLKDLATKDEIKKIEKEPGPPGQTWQPYVGDDGNWHLKLIISGGEI
ncbi:hypothetical protein [Limosilactobacillus coleohominis]|uniref:hypothetical protein n=1 Tax=Limosilactobacillus coleohominis TaxID=181675 RepID=UPI0026EAAE89|nr:hypothetical protein [Limosilactobacillus coleohominis]